MDLHWILFNFVIVIKTLPCGGSKIQFSLSDIKEYHTFYSKLSGPLQRITNQSVELFRLAKGAELVTYDLEAIHKTRHSLRSIREATQIKHQVVQYGLIVDQEVTGLLLRINATAQIQFGAKKTLSSKVLQLETLPSQVEQVCDTISTLSNCTKCTALGRCVRGHVPIEPWLHFALKTQREIQIDQVYTSVQILGAHNAFNNRGNGYGQFDDCPWPPPYEWECVSLANHEFSFTDMLNLGVHALEIDPWWCFDEIRMSHATDRSLGCGPLDRSFRDGMKEIGTWVNQTENEGIVIRLYFEDGATHTEGHDDLINGPLVDYFGDKILTPADKKKYFNNNWPTLRELRKLNKTVVISTGGNYTHGAMYIHENYWNEYIEKAFTPYPACGGRRRKSILRFYCDSTKYGPFWNGPNETGVILDFSEFMKCGIQYPASDQVNPVLLKTAVFTWAEGEPSVPLTQKSCVFLSGSSHRWYVSKNCSTPLYAVCRNDLDYEKWALSSSKGRYDKKGLCPDGFRVQLPVNGFQQQKVIEVAQSNDVWLNLTPYISLLMA